MLRTRVKDDAGCAVEAVATQVGRHSAQIKRKPEVVRYRDLYCDSLRELTTTINYKCKRTRRKAGIHLASCIRSQVSCPENRVSLSLWMVMDKVEGFQQRGTDVVHR